MGRVNARQLEAFNATMEAGSVTLAAETLHITQPAVTKLLQAFEETCGFDLFSRHGGRLVPTAEAQQIHMETQKIEAQMARVQESARAIRELERGEVSIVTFPGIGMRLVPKIVSSFMKAERGIKTSLIVRTSRGVADAMLLSAADFGVSLVPTTYATLTSERFARASMVCAVPSDHRLAGLSEIPISALAEERIISLGRDDLAFDVITRAFLEQGILYEPVAEVHMADAICAMVADGFGVGIVASFTAFERNDPGVTFVRLAEPIKFDLWLLRRKMVRGSLISLALIDRIKDAVETMERAYVAAPRE